MSRPWYRRWRPIAALIVLIAALIGAAFLFAPARNQIVPVTVQPGPKRTPTFAFKVGRSGALPTAFVQRKRPVRSDPLLHLRGASRAASKEAIASVTRLYREAFLDPKNWRPGTFGTLWREFAGGARSRARKDMRILTVGGAAGETYVAIVPRPSTTRTTVLLDRTGKPLMVLVHARFRALGTTISGRSNTRFESEGRFFLERARGSWMIESYDVRRSDRRVAKPSPGPSASSTSGAA